MNTVSEITIKDIWPKLCELGLIEIRINGRTIWSESAIDVLVNKDYYHDVCRDYLKCAEEELLGEWYQTFRVTEINIKVTDFHHCIADITGYYEEIEETA